MPKAFDDCMKQGGKVRTKTLSGDKYMRICYKGGKSYNGHVKRRMTMGGKHVAAFIVGLAIFATGCTGLGFKACVVPAEFVADYVQDPPRKAVCYQAGAGFETAKPVTIEEAK